MYFFNRKKLERYLKRDNLFAWQAQMCEQLEPNLLSFLIVLVLSSKSVKRLPIVSTPTLHCTVLPLRVSFGYFEVSDHSLSH